MPKTADVAREITEKANRLFCDKSSWREFMEKEIAAALTAAKDEALEEAAKALGKRYVMKGSENDGMLFIPTAQKTIRALKSVKQGGR